MRGEDEAGRKAKLGGQDILDLIAFWWPITATIMVIVLVGWLKK